MICTKCNQDLPKSEFRRPHRWPHCRPCEQTYARELRRRDPLARFATNSKGRYGVILRVSDLRRDVGQPTECYLCGDALEPGNREIDHVQPRSKGGETTTSNLRWACKRCNRIKHDLTLDELCTHLMRMLDHLA